jgi:DNA repair photolyase
MFVRWTNLQIEEDQRARLPGYRDEAVVRHFDAPGSIPTRFYEVRAKSILNRVPEASQMPFRWTINPYRGCTHACAYCVRGDTKVLTANGLHKAIADLEVGDSIYGTSIRDGDRRYAVTGVLDKWTTVKAAHRVALADGTELVASGDHRFLTDHGWKYVASPSRGGGDLGSGVPRNTPEEWARLTRGDQLLGPGRVAMSARAGRTRVGQALEAPAGLRVVEVRPDGAEQKLYDITTGTGDFIANGVVSHNCFARPTHRYLDFDAGRDFEREIVVKVNAPERLRAELARASWKGEHIALGTNTDPYQWVEGRYKLMQGIWEAMRDAANPCSVLTKSPLVLRDIELLKEINEVTEFGAAFSVPTLDERAWRATEPHTPHPRARLEAVAELTRAGIRTGVLVAPLMPGINDAPEHVEPILRLAEEAGAAYVTPIALHLRGEVRDVFFGWLAQQRPDLLKRYEQLYSGRAYLRPGERDRLEGLVRPDDAPSFPRMRAQRLPAPPRIAESSSERPRQPAQQRLF